MPDCARRRLAVLLRSLCGAVCADDILPRWKRWLRNCNGAALWAVSSTNRWVVEAGVAAFGIPREKVLAAAVRVADGLLTAELIDVPTDDGKARALRRAGVSAPDVVFGNSLHDLAMLEMARLAVPVNASDGLRRAAAERGWRLMQPAGAEGSEEIVGQD